MPTSRPLLIVVSRIFVIAEREANWMITGLQRRHRRMSHTRQAISLTYICSMTPFWLDLVDERPKEGIKIGRSFAAQQRRIAPKHRNREVGSDVYISVTDFICCYLVGHGSFFSHVNCTLI